MVWIHVPFRGYSCERIQMTICVYILTVPVSHLHRLLFPGFSAMIFEIKRPIFIDGPLSFYKKQKNHQLYNFNLNLLKL